MTNDNQIEIVNRKLKAQVTQAERAELILFAQRSGEYGDSASYKDRLLQAMRRMNANAGCNRRNPS